MRSTRKIAIVGGSISGCTAAIALMRQGHEVSVFERSRGELTGRGAGIGTPPSVIQSLQDRDMVDRDLPCFSVRHLAHVGRTPDGARLGRTSWVTPLSIELLNWGDLYRSLRRRVPDTAYHRGRGVAGAGTTDEGLAELTFADGTSARFDLVVFADGYQSLGRSLVCPDSTLDYRGYVLWRGVLEERALDDAEPLERTLTRLSHPEGHAVMYLVPGPERSVEPGLRWVNWACYLRVAPDDLPDFLIDRTGRQRSGSLPPGATRPEEEDRLKQMARDWLPPYYADIIAATEDTFVQPIYAAAVSGYRRGRLCLAGDAGAFLPPFTASGVFKGMHNALDLAAALAADDDIDRTLETWSRRETETGALVARVVERLEKALIWSVPDFGAMDEDAMRAWWKEAARMPDELFPSRSEGRRPAG